MRAYRILVRAGTQKDGRKAYMIGVPRRIAEALPDGFKFVPELTSEGLLFRPAHMVDEPPLDLPAWALSALVERDLGFDKAAIRRVRQIAAAPPLDVNEEDLAELRDWPDATVSEKKDGQ